MRETEEVTIDLLAENSVLRDAFRDCIGKMRERGIDVTAEERKLADINSRSPHYQ